MATNDADAAVKDLQELVLVVVYMEWRPELGGIRNSAALTRAPSAASTGSLTVTHAPSWRTWSPSFGWWMIGRLDVGGLV